MKRRVAIASIGLLLPSLTAGCFANRSDNGSDSRLVEAEPRIDEPPHEITRPESNEGDGLDGENERYLCENMADSPSLSFETLSEYQLVHEQLSDASGNGQQFSVEVVTEEDESDQMLGLNDADFENYVFVIIESGYGSGSVDHHWVRVEEQEDGLHIHGCYTQPADQTLDETSRESVLKVERPATGEIDIARVSLTTSEDRRVNFNSTENVVTVDR